MSELSDRVKQTGFDQGPSRLNKNSHMAGPGKMGDKFETAKATPMKGGVHDRKKEQLAAQRSAIAEELAKFVSQTQTFKNAVAAAAVDSQGQGKSSEATVSSTSTTPPAIPAPSAPAVQPVPFFPLPSIPDLAKPYALVWNPDATGGAKMEWSEIKDC